MQQILVPMTTFRPLIRSVKANADQLILLLMLVAAAALRFTGIDWDESTHIHPDERFLTMVETSLKLPTSIGEYFDTSRSPLNPHNVGYGFFVYGTLPVFLVRFVSESIGKTGYDEVHLVGRAASAAFDLVSIWLVYLIARRLYSRRVGLLAAAFAAFSVLLIQHAHFFVVDPFANTFILIGIYFAVRILDDGRLLNYACFGLALGMAMACKISAAPMAAVILLPALVRFYWLGKPVLSRALKRSEGPPSEEAEISAIPLFVRQGWSMILIGVGVSAVASLLAFRVFQPYAFRSLFSLALNPKWLANMAEISAQSSGDVDFPPALQWADRIPLVFSMYNLVVWGLGLPLGLAAWAGWAWALVQMVRGRWERHLIPVVWTGAYFAWQGTRFNPMMRYQLPIYPTLAILAAWGLWEAWEYGGRFRSGTKAVVRAAIAVIAVAVLGLTAAYAVGFGRIYSSQPTRAAASRWIYTHAPGPVNLLVRTEEGDQLEPVPVPTGATLTPGGSIVLPFTSHLSGSASAIEFPHLVDLSPGSGPRTLTADVLQRPDSTEPLGGGVSVITSFDDGETSLRIPLDHEFEVQAGTPYTMKISLQERGSAILKGNVQVVMATEDGEQTITVPLPQEEFALAGAGPGRLGFTSGWTGRLTSIRLCDVTAYSEEATLVIRIRGTLVQEGTSEPITLAETIFDGSLQAGATTSVEMAVDPTVELKAGNQYSIALLLDPGGAITMRGSALVSESSWDDGLPLRIDGRDFVGVYESLNLELYWQDDQDEQPKDGVSDKLQRIVESLAEGDYVVISSNRQYGTVPRVPQRYPLSTAYYRALFDCPEPEPVLNCGAYAQPRGSANELGYQLVQVFQSDPSLGSWALNDQLAEEAFTVYDHPKVLIFAKTDQFDEQRVLALLSKVDLSRVVHVTPKAAGSPPPDLMLPKARLEAQRQGGTWSELYDRSSLVNRSGVVAVVVWWVVLALFGLAALPITRLAFAGLRDGGYPLSRLVGLLIVAWAAWFMGSLGIGFSRISILGSLLALAACSGLLVWRDRHEWIAYLRLRAKEIAWVEVLMAVFFLTFLLIRLGNPDLWHPSKGGEKPMDFSYLNAVLKSTSFPPYDPWFAGGYINYYYYGFVLVGVPVKLIGMIPSIAYNLIIPTLFALSALAAYCVAYNLVRRPERGTALAGAGRMRAAGIAAAAALVVLGNLGTVHMIYDGWKVLGAAEGQAPARALQGLVQAARGFVRHITLERPLPYGLDSWYWDPSRAIPPGEGEPGPITEFPFFTFLYADLHAHMINLPVTVVCLAWCLSWLLAGADKHKLVWPKALGALFVGGVALGALRPTNSWDFPAFWGLAVLAMLAAAWLRPEKGEGRSLTERVIKPAIEGALVVAVGVGMAYLLYWPFSRWFGQGYTSVELWKGGKTGLSAYLTVHGVFLFSLVSWIAWETRQWMAGTPLRALARLRPYSGWLLAGLVAFAGLTWALAISGFRVAILVLPILLWAGLLVLRPGMPIEKRSVLVVVGTALALTFLVEAIVLRGDIGRMNTVFKFYLQVWTLFSVSAAAAWIWIWDELPSWGMGARRIWVMALAGLVIGAALYPLTAAQAKIKDRMAAEAPHSLDGMEFMPWATYHDLGESISLEEDYRAIQWLQDNVSGSPVIIEANIPEYRWGSRFTIYTGLPGVLGWNWHQRQQRVATGNEDVTKRGLEINDFYLTRETDKAWEFLKRYGVSYVMVGRLERLYYETVAPCMPGAGPDDVMCRLDGRLAGSTMLPVSRSDCELLEAQNPAGPLECATGGLAKFDAMAALGLLKVAYQDGATMIYEVLE